MASEHPKGFSGEFNIIFSHTFEVQPVTMDDLSTYAKRPYQVALMCRHEFVCFADTRIDIYHVKDQQFEKVRSFQRTNQEGAIFSTTYCKKDHSCIYLLKTQCGTPETKILKLDLQNGAVKWSTSLTPHKKDAYKNFHNFVIDSRGIIYLGDQTEQKIILICSESGQIIEKMGRNCKTSFEREVNFFYLTMDRNDNLMISCYDKYWSSIIKVFTRNLKYLKTVTIPNYCFSCPIIYDPLTDGYIFRSHTGIAYSSKDFSTISQSVTIPHVYSLSNGVLYCYDSNLGKVTCFD